MNTLAQAINATQTQTTNGMPAYTSSLDNVVDLFYTVGASRGKDILPAFSKAFHSDRELAIRVALWARDVRGGAGERQLFKDMLSYVVQSDVALAKRMMAKIPFLGRWDDILVLFNTPLERDALRMIVAALKNKDALCAKWMPRKGKDANKLRAYMKITPKEYRQTLSGLSVIVEHQLCAKEFDLIDFNAVPSVAAARYQKTFSRHQEERYAEYRSLLEAGDSSVKINAGAVTPVDIIKSLKMGDARVAQQQWKALPDYIGDSTENILPLVDVSDSMDCSAGGNKSITCMEVAISLGLYISERTKGAFKDMFVTFSEKPQLCTVKGELSDRYTQMARADWGGNTNFQAVFTLILNAAKTHTVPASEMPTKILILSDMQFDEADRTYSSSNASQLVKQMYADAGYEAPALIFWNLNASNGVPTTFNAVGTALVSGYSPAIMTSVLSCQHITPYDMMMEAISKERYSY